MIRQALIALLFSGSYLTNFVLIDGAKGENDQLQQQMDELGDLWRLSRRHSLTNHNVG